MILRIPMVDWNLKLSRTIFCLTQAVLYKWAGIFTKNFTSVISNTYLSIYRNTLYLEYEWTIEVWKAGLLQKAPLITFFEFLKKF